MATNLVSLAMKFLTPELISRIAQSLKLDNGLVQKAAGAAIPAILAGLVGKASKPDGLKAIGDAAARQDSSLLGNLAGMIGGTGQSSLINTGTNALTSLLGGSAISGLTGALAKYSGAGDGATKNLLGMLGPVVLGSIGQEQKSNKLDGGGLSSLLMAQKDNIAQALPGDFAKLLGGTGLLDSVQSNMRTAAAPAAVARKVETPARAGSGPGATVGSVAYKAPAPAAPWWRLPLIAAAALGLGWSLFGKEPPRSITAPTALPTAPRIVVDNVDVGNSVTGAMSTLQSALGGIRDTATAQTAVPKLQDAAGQLDRVTALAAKMSPETRKTLAALVSSGNTTLTPVIAAAQAIPGVSAVIKPALDAVRAKIDVLSKG